MRRGRLRRGPRARRVTLQHGHGRWARRVPTGASLLVLVVVVVERINLNIKRKGFVIMRLTVTHVTHTHRHSHRTGILFKAI